MEIIYCGVDMAVKDLFRKYSGDCIIQVSQDVYVPIVDSVVHKGDMVIMSGYQKSNKSTFAMQLACNVSSGTPFLGIFSVPRPYRVWYFSTEGKDEEFRERIIRMKNIVPVNLDNILLLCSSQFKINTPAGQHGLRKLLEDHAAALPELIIIDSVYSSFKGSLKDDDVVNEYLTILRELSEACGGAALFMFHHLKKPSRTPDGKVIPATDSDTFGSAFFGGQADHMFRIEQSGKSKMDRRVVCETQRSSRIVEEMHLHLNEPDPFYLTLVDKHDTERDVILSLIRDHPDGIPAHKLITQSHISKSLCYIVLNKLMVCGVIKKEEGYGGKYLFIQ